MKNKYSKIYHTSEEKNFGFRYNYETKCLEWVSNWDMVWDGEKKEYIDITLPDWKVTSSIGLSLENWKESPEYWVEQYQSEISEECTYEVQYI